MEADHLILPTGLLLQVLLLSLLTLLWHSQSVQLRFQPYALRVATENDYHGGMGDPMLRYGAVNAR